MEEIRGKLIFNRLNCIELISDMVPKIIEWDLSPIQGVGYYKKIEHYGHIELKIYIDENTRRNCVIWNVEEYQIPVGLKQKVCDYLNYFINFLTSIKGRLENSIVIEVTDGSFHPIDSWRWGFNYATVYAFIDCFDKELSKSIQRTPIDRDYIKKLQQGAFNRLKNEARKFSTEEILYSLKDIGLNNIIKYILENKNSKMIDFHVEKYMRGMPNTEMSLIIQTNLNNEVKEELISGKVISKYDELTDIGWAHIGMILNKSKIFKSLSITDLSSINGYYDINFMDKHS